MHHTIKFAEDFGMSQYVDHPADFCFVLPPNVSFEEGAMCEPLSVGVHACRRGGVSPGKTVAILGAGPIGELVSACIPTLFPPFYMHPGVASDCECVVGNVSDARK
jgi:threonine dehydrogenase-like Zn-dependent dehydrogenase